MQLKKINCLDDIVLAYKKEQLITTADHGELWHIEKFRISEDGKYTEVYLHGITTDIEVWYYTQFVICNFYVVIAIDTNSNFKFTSTNYINQNNKNKMENNIQQMIQEHKELVPRIENLHAWVHGDAYKTVNAVEFGNECIQLKGMKVYEEALRARLFNAGVNYVDGQYLIAIDSISNEKEDSADND